MGAPVDQPWKTAEGEMFKLNHVDCQALGTVIECKSM